MHTSSTLLQRLQDCLPTMRTSSSPPQQQLGPLAPLLRECVKLGLVTLQGPLAAAGGCSLALLIAAVQALEAPVGWPP